MSGRSVFYNPGSQWKWYAVISFYLGLALLLLLRSWCKIIWRCRLAPSIARSRTQERQPLRGNNTSNASPQLQSGGLASSIIQSLPAVRFGEEPKRSDDDGSSDCSICLGEFREGEWLRLLPNCAHIFHISCIDAWFQSHSTCPLCRTGVLHGFSNGDSSASVIALLETLPREGVYSVYRERPMGYHLPEYEAIRNQEHRQEGSRPESATGESSAGMARSSMASTSDV